MTSSKNPLSWKTRALLLVFSGINLTTAAPLDDPASISAGVSSVAALANTITQSRVKQVVAASGDRRSEACCNLLKVAVGGIVSDPGSSAFRTSIASYWSTQASSVEPWCLVSPASTSDVSKTVGTLNLLRTFGLKCPYAIRSGGHTPFAGAATIKNGITISLAAINQVTISGDKKSTSIGPGARWFDVYSKLEPENLIVVGGRVSTVGVGGLVTGGGVSFFSGRYGFSVDNVQAYEVVLYDGSVVIANPKTRTDLFWALKGGSSNFGIVTRFDVNAYTQGEFLGGQIVLPYSTKAENLAAFVHFTGQPDYDPYGALINTYVFSAATGWLIVNAIEYGKPEMSPSAFKNFTAMQPQYQNTLRIAKLTNFTNELAGVQGPTAFQLFVTSTWTNDLDLLTQIVDMQETYAARVASVKGVRWSFTIQPLPSAITGKAKSTGGNAMGLVGDQNLILAMITATWDNAADEIAVSTAVTDFFAKADALAASKGMLNSYKYLNYAHKTQDPIKGYGAANVAKLRAVSKKYDPFGVFQTQVPGGFKLVR